MTDSATNSQELSYPSDYTDYPPKWIYYACHTSEECFPQAKRIAKAFLAKMRRENHWKIESVKYQDAYHVFKKGGMGRVDPMIACDERAYAVYIPNAPHPLVIYFNDRDRYVMVAAFAHDDSDDYADGLVEIIKAYISLKGPDKKVMSKIYDADELNSHREWSVWSNDKSRLRTSKPNIRSLFLVRGIINGDKIEHGYIHKYSLLLKMSNTWILCGKSKREITNDDEIFWLIDERTLGLAKESYGMDRKAEFWGLSEDKMVNLYNAVSQLRTFWTEFRKCREYKNASARKRRETGDGTMEWDDIISLANEQYMQYAMESLLDGVPIEDIFA